MPAGALREQERGDVEVTGQRQGPYRRAVPRQRLEARGLGLDLVERCFWHRAQLNEFAHQVAALVEAEALRDLCALDLLALVLLRVVIGDVFVVAGQRLVGGVGNAVFQRLEIEDSEQRVAATDLRVEEAERQAGVHGLDPERDLGQLHRHRVSIHAVNAASRDVAQSMAEIRHRRRALGADAGEPSRDAARGGEQEVA